MPPYYMPRPQKYIIRVQGAARSGKVAWRQGKGSFTVQPFRLIMSIALVFPCTSRCNSSIREFMCAETGQNGSSRRPVITRRDRQSNDSPLSWNIVSMRGFDSSSCYKWTTGNDSNLTHVREIDSGGYGSVHEVQLHYDH